MTASYETWMQMVDTILVRMSGVMSDDLPDVCYRDMYDDGMTPIAAARAALRSANE